MQDVTRLLYLLNKNPRNVQIPPDGMQLLNWSEEILKRYLQSQVSNKLKDTIITFLIVMYLIATKNNSC